MADIEVSLNDIEDISEYGIYEKQRQVNEAIREENEAKRIFDEDTRKSNEIVRQNYYNFIKEKFENKEFDGLSAYGIAVEKGYEGTEEEWLMSLKGQDGIQGERGIQGEKGEQGLQGEKGDTGEKGEKGDAFTFEDFTQEQLASLKGEKGDTGEKGQQGERGLQGEKGEQGIQGEKGEKGEKGDKGDPGNSISYDDTELRNRMTAIENIIENTIEDLSNILDEINGEVI